MATNIERAGTAVREGRNANRKHRKQYITAIPFVPYNATTAKQFDLPDAWDIMTTTERVSWACATWDNTVCLPLTGP